MSKKLPFNLKFEQLYSIFEALLYQKLQFRGKKSILKHPVATKQLLALFYEFITNRRYFDELEDELEGFSIKRFITINSEGMRNG